MFLQPFYLNLINPHPVSFNQARHVAARFRSLKCAAVYLVRCIYLNSFPASQSRLLIGPCALKVHSVIYEFLHLFILTIYLKNWHLCEHLTKNHRGPKQFHGNDDLGLAFNVLSSQLFHEFDPVIALCLLIPIPSTKVSCREDHWLLKFFVDRAQVQKCDAEVHRCCSIRFAGCRRAVQPGKRRKSHDFFRLFYLLVIIIIEFAVNFRYITSRLFLVNLYHFYNLYLLINLLIIYIEFRFSWIRTFFSLIFSFYFIK